MTGPGPTDQRPRPPEDLPEGSPSPSAQRMGKQTFTNMLRSLVPLVVLVLAVVWWTSFRQDSDVDPVKPVETASTVQLAANRASYPLLVPTDLPDGYRPTSARTDAGGAGDGDPVTLEIGYVTPSGEFAAFVVSDDPRADAVTALLGDATEAGTVDIDGETWTRSTHPVNRSTETVLSREADGVTVAVGGSASEAELEAVAGALEPYSG